MIRAVCLLAIAGCLDTSVRYPVDAVAELVPTGAAAIAGPLELLGANSEPGDDDPFDDTEFRTFAAYRVALPDTAPRRVRVYNAASCDAPREELAQVADLESIQRSGDETHFVVGGIDVDTIAALISTDPDGPWYVLGRIAVVQDPDGAGGVPGAWLACGVFAAR